MTNTGWKRLFHLELLFVEQIKLSFNTHCNFREGSIPRATFQFPKMGCLMLTRTWLFKCLKKSRMALDFNQEDGP